MYFSVCTSFHLLNIKIFKKFFRILNPYKKFLISRLGLICCCRWLLWLLYITPVTPMLHPSATWSVGVAPSRYSQKSRHWQGKVSKKKKKIWNFPYLGFDPPPPVKIWIFFFWFSGCFSTFGAYLKKKWFFPLKSWKYLEYFHNLVLRPPWPPRPPPWPLTKGKIFLCISGCFRSFPS